MIKLVLVRHGESVWNKENLFTGWTDVELSEKGVQEAKEAGKILKEKGFHFDIAFTSELKRAQNTLSLILEELDQHPTIKKSWRLNERHYGALQGLNKAETAAKYGEDQVHIWRRSFDTPPPVLEESDERHPMHDQKYNYLKPEEKPATESLKDTIERLMPYWESDILPSLKSGQKIIIAAHGNSLRGLIKHLDNISDENITELNIPTGNPLVYELDEKLKPIKHYYLKG
ncbi:2,3-diphosphoglycerate-dependent phosphoglycerate mutase [Candidatus Peregrinibacteria bacterium CG10_big_fil_rev_8_21_14_0_10_36_19]|nr:MAG: 2,3-diphosphoglycerate-dependent phosphoglycerate mutase [Candidatus Peregrinibacteria bacterium CG10_big_fil_rev_8_21_14_0_10_36_19]